MSDYAVKHGKFKHPKLLTTSVEFEECYNVNQNDMNNFGKCGAFHKNH